MAREVKNEADELRRIESATRLEAMGIVTPPGPGGSARHYPKQQAKTQERQESTERLRKWLSPGDTVYTILRHVSSSGMSRVIDLLKIGGSPASASESHRVIHMGRSAAVALGLRWDDRKEGIVVGGAGMDMGFSLVYDLGRVLYPGGTRGGYHAVNAQRDGGYAFKQEWL